MPKKKNASSLISELKRKTRRKYSSEEKINFSAINIEFVIEIGVFSFRCVKTILYKCSSDGATSKKSNT